MIELIIEKRARDLGGGFEVGRVLPFAKRRMVGPFVFSTAWDRLSSPPALRTSWMYARVPSIQAWVALPAEDEETDPAFYHHEGADLPEWRDMQPSKVMVLGGEPIGERFLFWNFVSSSRERLEQTGGSSG